MVEWVNESKLGQIRILCVLDDPLYNYRIEMPILSLFHWTAFKREKTNIKDVYLPIHYFPPYLSLQDNSYHQHLETAGLLLFIYFKGFYVNQNLWWQIYNHNTRFHSCLASGSQQEGFGYRRGFSTLTINIMQLLKK